LPDAPAPPSFFSAADPHAAPEIANAIARTPDSSSDPERARADVLGKTILSMS
jgi:hypothetical protein